MPADPELTEADKVQLWRIHEIELARPDFARSTVRKLADSGYDLHRLCAAIAHPDCTAERALLIFT